MPPLPDKEKKIDTSDNSNAEGDLESPHNEGISDVDGEQRRRKQMVRNRRKTYLDRNSSYFSSDLELADPLLYDRLIRRFQTTSEREAEGRAKGYSGVLEADLLRSEAKINALAKPDPNQAIAYGRTADGSIAAEDQDEAPLTKEEGESRWRQLMAWRFLRGDDTGFDYSDVDNNETYDDQDEQRRDAEDAYFREEEPSWILDEGSKTHGETGIQDF